MVKGGQGTWDVMFFRFAVNPETKKPAPATMEQVMLQIDYDGGHQVYRAFQRRAGKHAPPPPRQFEVDGHEEQLPVKTNSQGIQTRP
jgi:hypothetical protein